MINSGERNIPETTVLLDRNRCVAFLIVVRASTDLTDFVVHPFMRLQFFGKLTFRLQIFQSWDKYGQSTNQCCPLKQDLSENKISKIRSGQRKTNEQNCSRVHGQFEMKRRIHTRFR